jgi:hypothetical protein
MPQLLINNIKGKSAIGAFAVITFFLALAGCSRHEESAAPSVPAADRALPIAVDIPAAPPTQSALAASVQQVIPAEDRLEPVSIDDASVPGDTPKRSGKTKKK